MTEGNVFILSPLGGGAHQTTTVTGPWSLGGVGYSSQDRMGYPSPTRTEWVPHPPGQDRKGTLLVRTEWGTPQPQQRQDGVPPPSPGQIIPRVISWTLKLFLCLFHCFSYHRQRLFYQHPLITNLSATLLHVFVSIEMTGQGVEFEQKFNYRRPMYTILEYIWDIEVHRDAIKVSRITACIFE